MLNCIDLTRMECKGTETAAYISLRRSIDLTRMECKAMRYMCMRKKRRSIDLTRMECKVIKTWSFFMPKIV